MLGKDFVKINSVRIPTPATYSTSYNNIEDTNLSEAGTERTVITRLLKNEISFNFQVTEFWRLRLLSFGSEKKVTLQIGTQAPLHGRFRISGDTLQPHSETTSVPLYSVSAKFYQI